MEMRSGERPPGSPASHFSHLHQTLAGTSTRFAACVWVNFLRSRHSVIVMPRIFHLTNGNVNRHSPRPEVLMTTLQKRGNSLFLGKTKMAEAKKDETGLFRYHLGPSDTVSEPYDALNDARVHLGRLLSKATG